MSALLSGGARACTRAFAERRTPPGAGSAMQKLAKCLEGVAGAVRSQLQSYRMRAAGLQAAAMLQARRRSSEGALFALPLAKSVTEREGVRFNCHAAGGR